MSLTQRRRARGTDVPQALDQGEWELAGRDLLRLDPVSYRRILVAVQGIVELHTAPDRDAVVRDAFQAMKPTSGLTS